MSQSELQQKIDAYSKRLEELSGTENSRIRKRIMSNIGKLRKQLAIAPEYDAKIEVPKEKLPKKQLKAKLHLLNEELMNLSQKKQLKLAIKAFKRGERDGLPLDVHAYGNLINAYVRCGQVNEGHEVLKKMVSVGISPNNVVLTILMKGYCESGDMKTAKDILLGMSGTPESAFAFPNCVPNIRAITTFLRGCVRYGCVDLAMVAIDTMHYHKLAFDITVLDYTLYLLCQSLQYEQAKALLAECIDQGVDVGAAASVYVSLARCSLILGELGECVEWISTAKKALVKLQNSPLLAAMISHYESNESSTSKKRTFSEVSGDNSSRMLFVQHQANEIQHEMELIEETLKFLNSSKPFWRSSEVSLPFSEDILKVNAHMIFAYFVLYCYSHLFVLDDIQIAKKQTAVISHIIENLSDKFGLMRLIESISNGYNSSAVGTVKKSSVRDNILTAFITTVTQYVDKSGRILLTKISPECESAGYNIEVAAGSGDWVVEHLLEGLAEKNITLCRQRSGWTSLEIRCDRVYSTLFRFLLRKFIIFASSVEREGLVSNAIVQSLFSNPLTIVGGDAVNILKEHFHEHTFRGVYINHPEPPERTGLRSDGKLKKSEVFDWSSGKHLLTAQFVNIVHDKLKSNGVFCVVTDNKQYSYLIAHEMWVNNKDSSEGKLRCLKLEALDDDMSSGIGASRPAHRWISGTTGELVDPSEVRVDIDVAIANGGVAVFQGQPDSAVGHYASNASSYFNRMWNLGEFKRRWYIAVERL